MPVLVAIFRVLAAGFTSLSGLRVLLGFIWRFLKILALHPISWIAMSFGPLLMTFYEMLTGNKTILSTFVSGLVGQIFAKMFDVVVPVNLQEKFSSVSIVAMEVLCYLGALEALQILLNGLVTAILVILSLRINIFLISLRYKFAKMTRM